MRLSRGIAIGAVYRLGWTSPDPKEVQYKAMLKAAKALCARMKIEKHDMFVWVSARLRTSGPSLVQVSS